MKSVCYWLAALCLGYSGVASAFTPANGLWGINAELNGSPGRGFQIEVENETVVLTYYGYRPDGSSAFYLASGPLTGNTFTAPLTEYRGGTPVGQSYRPGVLQGTPGFVSITFTSGTAGTATFPGEAPKAVRKFSFGYSPTPQSLLGTYMVGYAIGVEFRGQYRLLSRIVGTSTDIGSGLVATPDNSFVCEYAVRGALAGHLLCTDVPNTSNANHYLWRMVGDHGSGVGKWYGTELWYQSLITRLANANGRRIGINDRTPTAMDTQLVAGPNANVQKSQPVGDPAHAVPVSQAERDALHNWAQQVPASLIAR